jgi:uncharacterized membrane protein
MTTSRANLLCLFFIGTVVAIAAYLYPGLPDAIPTHWNLAGEVDGYMNKPWGVIVLPAAAVFSFGIMRLIPIISPRGFRTDQFIDVVNIFTVVIVGFMCGVTILVLLEASGRNVYINEAIFAAVGLLLIVLGNYMGKVRKNFFIGIRTPWTLASDEVWSRTHRLGGRVFMLAGLFVMLNSVVELPEAALATTIVIAVLVPVVYSYLIYRQIEGFPSGEDNDPIDANTND